jgi:hypothetical protein
MMSALTGVEIKGFPPSQKAGSFSIDGALVALQRGGGNQSRLGFWSKATPGREWSRSSGEERDFMCGTAVALVTRQREGEVGDSYCCKTDSRERMHLAGCSIVFLPP